MRRIIIIIIWMMMMIIIYICLMASIMSMIMKDQIYDYDKENDENFYEDHDLDNDD